MEVTTSDGGSIKIARLSFVKQINKDGQGSHPPFWKKDITARTIL
jgi:hypothetical protein